MKGERRKDYEREEEKGWLDWPGRVGELDDHGRKEEEEGIKEEGKRGGRDKERKPRKNENIRN